MTGLGHLLFYLPKQRILICCFVPQHHNFLLGDTVQAPFLTLHIGITWGGHTPLYKRQQGPQPSCAYHTTFHKKRAWKSHDHDAPMRFHLRHYWEGGKLDFPCRCTANPWCLFASTIPSRTKQIQRENKPATLTLPKQNKNLATERAWS